MVQQHQCCEKWNWSISHEHGTKKKSESPTGIEPMTSRRKNINLTFSTASFTFPVYYGKAGVALETKLRQVCLDNQKIRQIPVISWPRQVRLTCLEADKNLSAETNLQRCRRPTSEHDFLRTTNKNCFSCDKPVSQFCKLWVFFGSHFTFPRELCSAVFLHSHIIMNPSYLFYFNIDPDQTNLNEAQDQYRPGQLFWRRNQTENQQIAGSTKEVWLEAPVFVRGKRGA